MLSHGREGHSHETKTHCRKGHSDWRFSASGRRTCKACHKAHYTAYNARKKNASGKHTKTQWLAKLATYLNCPRCGVDLSTVQVHKDHIVPLVSGGTNDIDNLQPLCIPCNLSKGAKVASGA